MYTEIDLLLERVCFSANILALLSLFWAYHRLLSQSLFLKRIVFSLFFVFCFFNEVALSGDFHALKRIQLPSAKNEMQIWHVS